MARPLYPANQLPPSYTGGSPLETSEGKVNKLTFSHQILLNGKSLGQKRSVPSQAGCVGPEYSLGLSPDRRFLNEALDWEETP